MINSVTLIGNLGGEPEVRYTPNGTAVANFSIAVNEVYKDRESEEKISRTHWFRCVAYGRVAETIGQYLNKGSKVGIQGSLQYREWESEENGKRSIVEIRVRQIAFLSWKGASEEDENGNIPF